MQMERVQIEIWSVSRGGGCTGCFEPVEILPASHVNSLIDPPPSPFVAFQFLIRAGSFLQRCFPTHCVQAFLIATKSKRRVESVIRWIDCQSGDIDRFEKVLKELKESR